MNIISSFRDIHRHFTILIYPIIFDVIALLIGLSLIGLQGSPVYSIKLILEMGIPSVSHIATFPSFVNHIDFLNLQEKVSVLMLMIVAFMLIVRSFLQGGYIQQLNYIKNDTPYSFSKFLHYGKRNWLQLFFLEIIIFLGKIAVTTFLVIFFHVIGSFAGLAFFVFLRILYIYLEFTIVVDRVNITTGLRKSWGYLKETFFPSFPLIFIMYIVSGAVSYFLHKFWSLPFIFFTIILYAYLMTVIQMAFMKIFHHAKRDKYA